MAKCDIILGMKTTKLFFWSLATVLGAVSAQASDCMGTDCNIEPTVFEEFEWIELDKKPDAIILATPAETVPTWLDSDPMAAQIPDAQPTSSPDLLVQAKLLTIKPVPEDNRPPLWDGTNGKYTGTTAVQTVDWKNGVPIWDDSIASYKYKDFSDWFLEPTPEIYLRELSPEEARLNINPKELYLHTMEDAAATRARVEELLAPKKPSGNLWFENLEITETPVEEDITVRAVVEQETIVEKQEPVIVEQATITEIAQPVVSVQQETVAMPVIPVALVADDGCPFDSETECEIWRRKPIVRETVSPRSTKLRATNVTEFLDVIKCNKNISASHPAAAPLLDRYKMLLNSANACCTDGMAYELKQAGATDALIYKFLVDDANFYGIGARCLMMTDSDLDTKFPNTATAVVAADVRNGCLCRGRQWFKAMLAPFQQIYQYAPEFKNMPFYYTYKDGLQREITVSINNDVQNIMNQLEQCP